MKTPLRILLVLVAAAALAVAAGCGDAGPSGGGVDVPAGFSDEAEAVWTDVVAGEGLTPDANAVEVVVTGEGPTLTVTVTVPSDAPGTVTFGDGLYGATAWSYVDGAWTRVDTADIRTEIAPLLDPGQSASFELPVKEADGYRVLVPAGGAGAWGDL